LVTFIKRKSALAIPAPGTWGNPQRPNPTPPPEFNHRLPRPWSG
jgi:hypothetical protein